MKQEITYFEKGGSENTDAVMQIALKRFEEGDIDTVIVASSLGITAQKAAEKFKQAITYQENARSMASVYPDMASTYLKLSKFELAEESYLKALEINPRLGYASYRLALLYLQQGKTEQAIPFLRKVIRLMPDTLEAKSARTILFQLKEENRKTENLNQ